MSTSNNQDQENYYPPVSPVAAGLKCSCPRCGQGRLFAGLLSLPPSCRSCQLDYAFADSGDGPAVFVILIMGFVILGLALGLDSVVRLPYWAMAMIWIPVILISCLWALRFGKALMIALQYQTHAGQLGATAKLVDGK